MFFERLNLSITSIFYSIKIENQDEETSDMKRNEHTRESFSSDSEIRVKIPFPQISVERKLCFAFSEKEYQN